MIPPKLHSFSTLAEGHLHPPSAPKEKKIDWYCSPMQVIKWWHNKLWPENSRQLNLRIFLKRSLLPPLISQLQFSAVVFTGVIRGNCDLFAYLKAWDGDSIQRRYKQVRLAAVSKCSLYHLGVACLIPGHDNMWKKAPGGICGPVKLSLIGICL